MKSRFFLPIMTTIVVFLAVMGQSRAQIALKPNGHGAAPLHVKILHARAVIEFAQFATTDLDLTFQNEVANRIEADFLYTLPDGAVVTDFAYFFGNERVIARIAEKKRAAAIYQHITEQRRDPALVEMVGKNTFRARISPVMPNADLRVQIRFVQALPVNSQNTITYTMPLRTQNFLKWEALSLDIQVVGLENGAAVRNNFGLPLVVRGGSPHFGFSAKNYRTAKDLRVGISLSPVLTKAHLLSARSGGQNGFFALAVVGKTRITRANAPGIYDVETTPLGNGLLVCGRYKGNREARLPLSQIARPLPLETRARITNPAEKLWANLRIARLSRSEENRQQVVALSQRFTVPSRWTSWIAIPAEERERFEAENRDEKTRTDLSTALGKLTVLQDRGSGASRVAQNLEARIAVLCKKTGDNPHSALIKYRRQRTYFRSEQTAQRIAFLIAQGRANHQETRLALAHLDQRGEQSGANFRVMLSDALGRLVSEYQDKVITTIAQGKANTPSAQKTRRAFVRVCQALKIDPTTSLQTSLPYEAQQAAREWAEQSGGKSAVITRDDGTGVSLQSDTMLTLKQQAELKARAVRLANASKQDPGVFLEQAEIEQQIWNLIALRQTRDAVCKEEPSNKAQIAAITRIFVDEFHRTKERCDTPRARRPLPSDYYIEVDRAATQVERIAARIESQQLDEQLASAPNTADITALRTRRAELTQLRARIGDPLLKVDAPADARTVVAQMPSGDLLPLRWDEASRTWQARFDIPNYAAEGAYVVTVLIVRHDGTRERRTFRYNVDMTAPRGIAKVAQTETGVLRLMVNADEDTARVAAFLPGGGILILTASAPGHFFALTEGKTKAGIITFILTDRAHNRATFTANATTAKVAR